MQCHLYQLDNAWNRWRKLLIQVQVSNQVADQDNKQLLSKVNAFFGMFR